MLIIISGLPGTGKTTFAKTLAGRLGVRHLNTDIIRDELHKRRQYDAATKALIYQVMEERTSAFLRQGETVIVDATFYKDDLRQPYLALAETQKQPLKWIELQAGEATIRKRVEQKRDYSEADYSVYQKIKKAYEPLLIPHLILSSDELHMDEMIQKAVTYLDEKNQKTL